MGGSGAGRRFQHRPHRRAGRVRSRFVAGLGLVLLVGLVSSALVVGGSGAAAIDQRPLVNLELSTIWNAGGQIPAVVSGDLVWIPVSETASGSTDLNGDGDSDDWVAHVYDPLTGVTSLGLAVVPTPGALAIDDGFVFSVDESAQGVDLNGDGDSEDWVAHIHTRSTGVVNLAVAAVYFPDRFYGDESRVVLPVPESEQGGSDLNGDGDSDDRVIHMWSASRGLENTAAAMCPDSAPIVLYPGGFAFAVGEEQSNCVMAVYEPGTGVKSLDLQVSFELWERAAAGAGGFAFLALESANSIETDLNGDGDYGDEVIHFYRTGSGVVNLGLVL